MQSHFSLRRCFRSLGWCRGGYTTFSTFAGESALLRQDGRLVRAAGYAVSSATLTIAAMLAGFGVARVALR